MKKFLTTKHIQDLVDLMPDNPNRPELCFIDEVTQFRLLNISVPRNSGKTTAIKEFIRGKSVLFIDACKTFTSIPNFMGHRSTGLRYQYIVIDEPQKLYEDSFFNMLLDLNHADMLSDDFKIITIGTHT